MAVVAIVLAFVDKVIFTFIDLSSRTGVSGPIEEVEKLAGSSACAESLMRIWEQNRQSEFNLERGLSDRDTRGHGCSKIEFKSPA